MRQIFTRDHMTSSISHPYIVFCKLLKAPTGQNQTRKTKRLIDEKTVKLNANMTDSNQRHPLCNTTQ